MKIVAFILSFFILTLHAEDEPKTGTELVKVKLISEYEHLMAGNDQWIGLLMTIEEGWHTYWRYAGDSGLPTMLDWLSENKNVEISDIKWPVPEKIKFSGMANYGYEDQVLLMMKIKVPKDFEKNKIVLKADANWLVCKEKCLPGNKEVSLELPVRNSPSLPTEYKTMFEDYSKMLPLENEYFTAEAKFKGGDIVLELLEEKHIDYSEMTFFPYEAEIISNGKDQKIEKNDGRTKLIMPLDQYRVKEPEQLKGILVFDKKVKDNSNAVKINVPIKPRRR